jgi:hypothetical protein
LAVTGGDCFLADVVTNRALTLSSADSVASVGSSSERELRVCTDGDSAHAVRGRSQCGGLVLANSTYADGSAHVVQRRTRSDDLVLA